MCMQAKVNAWLHTCMVACAVASLCSFRPGRVGGLTGADGLEKQCSVSGRRDSLYTPQPPVPVSPLCSQLPRPFSSPEEWSTCRETGCIIKPYPCFSASTSQGPPATLTSARFTEQGMFVCWAVALWADLNKT